MITVVIPYFQRQSGVLRRALDSVAAQQSCPLPVQVIIVDDGSPCPAEPELQGLSAHGVAWRVIHQANAGPGAARNRGLDAARPDTRYIAFLDSDDSWSPDHLARAVAALHAGFDFYFADHLQIDQQIGAFARAGRIQPREHPLIVAPEPNLHAYTGDLFDQILTGNVIGTSTVVFDHRVFPDMRFRTEYRCAGEDYLFWMDIARQEPRVAFSSRIETTYGRGVNVFAGAGWGTEGHLRRLHDELKFKKSVLELYELTLAQRQLIQRQIHSLRLSFSRDLLHRIFHRKHLSLQIIMAQGCIDPMTLLLFPVHALSIAFRRK